MRSFIFLIFFFTGLIIATSSQAQTLREILIDKDTLSYMGYEVKRSYDEQAELWYATVEKEEKTLATFTYGGPLKEMTRFGLFSFLGKKTKELIIEQYSGGAHCCWSYWIFQLAPHFTIIYDSQEYPVGYPLNLVDANNDGVYEFTQGILTFDYFDRLSHVVSPIPTVIFAYDEKKGRYVPANHIYPRYVLSGIVDNIDQVEKLNESIDFTAYEDLYGEYLSAILRVVLRYIYAGYETMGWAFYETEYHLSDKEEMRIKIKEKLETCAIYRYIYGKI